MDVPADDDGDESTQPEAAQASAAPPPPEQASFPDATPPPPPPRVDLGADAPAPGKKGTKAEASAAPPPPDGRQWFLGFMTAQWEGAMVAMTSELEAIGVKPWIAVEDLKPAVYATFEQVIPKHFKASPPMVAAAGSTAITVQYYLSRKQIAEAKRAKNARDANPAGARVEEMRRADEEEKARARAADEKKAAAIDANIGTPPPPPPEHDATEPLPVTQLAIVRKPDVSRAAVAAEVERMTKDASLVF